MAKKKIASVFLACALVVCLSLFTLAACTDEHTHALTKISAADPDCTKEGNTEYYSCECGKYFKDSEGKTEIKEGSWKIAALGHDYSVVLKEGKYYNVCSRGDSEVLLADEGTSETYPILASDKDALAESVKKGGFVKLTADLSMTSEALNEALAANENHKAVNIDLGGKTMTLTSETKTQLLIENGQTLSVKNGSFDLQNEVGEVSKANVKVFKDSGFTLNNVKVLMNGGGILATGENAAVTIIGSEVKAKGSFAVSTNAGEKTNYGVKIVIEKSTIDMVTEVTKGDTCAVMINVRGTLDIKNSKINGQRQGVIVRAGTATIVDTEITAVIQNLTGDADINRTSHTATWGSGNEVAFGAVVVGNDTQGTAETGTYLDDAILNISGGKVVCKTEDGTLKNYTNALYGLRLNNDAHKTEITVSGTTFEGLIVNYNETATVKGLKDDAVVLTTWDSVNGEFIVKAAE